MLKLILTISFLLTIGGIKCQQEAKNQTRAICPSPFTNQVSGYYFNNCYYYAGKTGTFSKAISTCSTQVNSGLVSPKFTNDLDDLYKLYKAYPEFYFWVGAIATPAQPTTFRWSDGSYVYPSFFCSGHPKGGENLCAFYTTTAVIGRDKCISTGPCTGSIFDHGIICQYGIY